MSPVKNTLALEKLLSRHKLQLRTDSKKSDIKTVQELMYASFTEYGLDRLVQWYDRNPEAFVKEYFGANQNKRVGRIIQTQSGEVVGSGFIIQHCGKKPYLAELSKVYLREEFHNKGIGKALVVDLIGQAEKLGFSSIYLSTRVEFDKAIQLYKQLGFAQIPHPYYSSPKSIAMLLDVSK